MKATDGGEVYSPNVGGTSFNCTFLPRAEKYQKSRPKVLDIPHSRHGLVVAGDTLIARTHPASRLSVTHALSPLGLAVKAALGHRSKLSGTSFGVDQCVRADGSL